jgi:hypothetical protein
MCPSRTGDKRPAPVGRLPLGRRRGKVWGGDLGTPRVQYEAIESPKHGPSGSIQGQRYTGWHGGMLGVRGKAQAPWPLKGAATMGRHDGPMQRFGMLPAGFAKGALQRCIGPSGSSECLMQGVRCRLSGATPYPPGGLLLLPWAPQGLQ